MKGRLILITLIFSLAMLLLSAGCMISTRRVNSDAEKSQYLVAVNEIGQLNKQGKTQMAAEKISQLQQDLRHSEKQQSGAYAIPVLCAVGIFFFVLVFGYVYTAILRPFDKMKAFAVKISAGDFCLPLKYERSNYFGEFTWAFDSMRREITKARNCEREAVDNNKTVIATLSHDIRTPIASIRAYAEGLSASLDTSYERRERYLSVIRRKCDEVTRLTDDLFLHSISDLDKLKITLQPLEFCGFLQQRMEELAGEQQDVQFQKPDFTAYVNVDPNRLSQLAENLINNARKYAQSEIDVFLTQEEEVVSLHVRDYGSGIPDENMPFVFDKFYRGSNCGKEPGSGLGLYIVKYIAEKMGGTVQLRNRTCGLEAVAAFPVYIEEENSSKEAEPSR
ncbi:MAG: HAMP domain-containing histidine kinase [Lachnospiraceae bacterium]|nr:HAMP domain-containing histidine kinase [Lachnospiraceae bacterium]